ncbi:Selenoprotein P, N-terminal domain-containing protein [Aphelenchoides besseyi]|nr:Selenoprotein P, N-terminal domain-containing protein [Aphelenchoides besseyi]
MNRKLRFSFFILISWTLTTVDATKRVEICEDVSQRVRSSGLLEEYQGRRVILAFSGLHCIGCSSRLLRLSEVARHFSIEVVVITPPNESPVDVKRAARRYPALRFEAAPCSPCEFDEVLDTSTSKIFVLDTCGRLLHRYHESVTQFSQLKSSFPSHSCGQSCSAFERRKRDPDSTLPPVGCGPRKMLPPANEAEQTPVYTVQHQPSTKNRQYKQIFQQPSRQSPVTPQPVVSVAYSGRQPASQQRTQQQAQQVESTYQQQSRSYNRQGTKVQGRYQKYEPETNAWQNTNQYGAITTTQSPQASIPSTPYYNDRLAEQRRQLARQREEYEKRLRSQHSQSEVPVTPNTQIESPPPAEQAAIPFTQSFQPPRSRSDSIQSQQPSQLIPTPPSTTRRPPKTTKQPLTYSNVNRHGGGAQYGRRTYGNQPYESNYQMQQRRRNELAAQRHRAIQEKQKMELEQLQRQELQRQIAEQAARQAAMALQKESETKVEAAPLYHDDEEDSLDTTDYYQDIEEWTTAIPQVRLESPITPDPLPENPAEHPEFLFDLPCNGFTDEICYQQQSQLKPDEVHKCCQTRIVLTDQCVPGRCSNVTHQLCCIQKLLQSKFKCCNDKKQGEVLFASDSFSRCCYDGFVVEDDPCCPQSYSRHQWRQIYELCLPAVNVDLSRVRVPQKVVAGLSTTVDFDFSKTDKWKFDCKYGLHVPNYAYHPSQLDELSASPSSGELN